MNNKPENVYAIILAAGASSRFGSSKQLADWQDSNMLQHTIKLAESFFNKNIFVILGANVDRIQSTLNKSDITIVLNTNWQEGISSSIRSGIKALPENTEAVMMLLCDQPLLKRTSLKKLIALWQQQSDAIIAIRTHRYFNCDAGHHRYNGMLY